MSDSESDEDLDWSQLLDARVLKRGEKDHAPDGTVYQQSVLQKSRGAMYAVLGRPVKTSEKQLVECDWDPVNGVGVVRKTKGKFAVTMGWAVREQLYLFPEEVCYLCERGSMRCYLDNEPLSVEGVLSLALHLVGAEKLAVYSHLKKLGFVVRRDLAPHGPHEGLVAQSATRVPWDLTWWLAGSRFKVMAWRPVYLQYSTVYRDLQCVQQKPLFGYAAPRPPHDFLVWKPATKFKKSEPSNADFHVKVCSADLPVPKLAELEDELGKQAPKASSKRSAVFRMREGVRSVLYAVVDNGVVSFIRVGETRFEYL